MMGLKTKLALARTLVWVGLQPSPEVLRELVGGLCAGRADVIVLVQPDADADDLLLGHRTALQSADGRAILGLAAAGELARRARADLVAADAVVAPVRAHDYALTLAVAKQLADLTRSLEDVHVDAVVVTPDLIDPAVALAPPTAVASKPWFAQVDSLAQARALVAAGARRLALPAINSQGQLGMSPRQLVDAYRSTLAEAWRAEMAQFTFSTLHLGQQRPPHTLVSARPDGSVPGRPTPDASPARARPHHTPTSEDDDGGWLGGHHERGPDDHW